MRFSQLRNPSFSLFEFSCNRLLDVCTHAVVEENYSFLHFLFFFWWSAPRNWFTSGGEGYYWFNELCQIEWRLSDGSAAREFTWTLPGINRSWRTSRALFIIIASDSDLLYNSAAEIVRPSHHLLLFFLLQVNFIILIASSLPRLHVSFLTIFITIIRFVLWLKDPVVIFFISFWIFI